MCSASEKEKEEKEIVPAIENVVSVGKCTVPVATTTVGDSRSIRYSEGAHLLSHLLFFHQLLHLPRFRLLFGCVTFALPLPLLSV